MICSHLHEMICNGETILDHGGSWGRFAVSLTEIKLAGVSYGKRQQVISRLEVGSPVRLVRERSNRNDKNAVSVYVGWSSVGWIPAEVAVELAPLLDAGTKYDAIVISRTQFITDEGKATWSVRVLVELFSDAPASVPRLASAAPGIDYRKGCVGCSGCLGCATVIWLIWSLFVLLLLLTPLPGMLVAALF